MAAVEGGVTCRSCGRLNRSGRKFCAECGSALAVVCASCGTANEPDERFCGECGSPLTSEAPAPTGVERRLVSVLFADLVGFTALSEDRDAEDVRDLLSRYFDLARTLIERHGGTVEKFIGDAVMAVWGTPTTREDDAERAVRAGLELVSGVAALGDEIGLAGLGARAGVLTGEAAVTLGAVGQGMVAGDLVNAASRAQALAEPGTVFVGEATRRATEAAIAFEDAGPHEIKGREEPLRLWRALRVTAGRGGTLRADVAEPPFVGRDRELRLLKELFHASAEQGKAHLVSIVGIAGIGKSRLAWELQKYLDGVEQTVLWHAGRCLAYGEGVSFWALAEMVRMGAGIAEGEEAAAAREKLRATLAEHVADEEERAWLEPRLAQLLGLEEGQSGERRDLFAGWRLFFERIAERDPVVLVFEDLQWADAALLEFVEYLLEWSRNHAIFVLALARPEADARRPQLASGRNATTLSVEPLPPDAMDELLDGFAPGLPEALRHRVLDRAEGVPLYAVETVRMLLDRGLLEPDGDGFRPTGAIEQLDVPETLQALVAARLDGLAPEERRLVQDASVVGKTFTPAAIAAVAGTAEVELEAPLQALVRKEIVALRADARSPERGQYAFLQDLVRQIAYDMLSRKERKARHLAAAAYLEHEGSDGEQELAEILASHYVASLQLDRAADDAPRIAELARATLVKAGERASAVGANEGAQRYFEQALELAESPLAAAELHERAGRAARLALRSADAREHLERAIAMFEEIGLDHPAARVRAELSFVTWMHEHDLERATGELERSFELLAGDERDADLALLAVQLGRLLWFAGRADEGFERNELALEIGEALQLPEVLSQGFNTKALVLQSRGRREEARVLMQRARELALEHGAHGAALRGYVNGAFMAWQADDRRGALELSRAGVQLARKIGDRDSEAALGGWTVGLLASLGLWDEAVEAEDAVHEIRQPAAIEMVGLYIARGDLEAARERLQMTEAATDPNDLQDVAASASTRAELLLAEGRAAEALLLAEDAIRAGKGLGLAHGAVVVAVAYALDAALALGDDAKFDELLGMIEQQAPGQRTGLIRAYAARAVARRAARTSDAQTAETSFAAAARVFREIEVPFDLAVVLLEHGEWLAARGRSDEAQPLLDEARTIFERLRATPWLERVASAQPESAESSVIPA